MNKLKKIWKSRKGILQGLWNKLFPTPTIEEIATYREDICRSCKYYDPKGTSPNAILPGYPACSICGCSVALMVRFPDSVCSREDIGEEPLWTAETHYRNEE